MKHCGRFLITVMALVMSLQLGPGVASAADDATLKELKEIIEKQQQAIEALERKVDALSKQQGATAAPSAEASPPAPKATVKTRGDKVAVKLYGHAQIVGVAFSTVLP